MKIRCPGCHVAYSLKEIPPSSVVVRCKKCGEKFILKPPQKRMEASEPATPQEQHSPESTVKKNSSSTKRKQIKRTLPGRSGKGVVSKLAWAAGVVLILAGLAVALGPYWIGVQIERQYEKNLKKYSQPGRFLLSQEEYKRGWFSSEARCLIEIPGEVKPLRAELHQRIFHGPVVFEKFPVPRFAAARIHTIPHMSKELERELFAELGSRPPLDITSIAGFNGEVHTKIVSPKYSGKSTESKNSFAWEGLELTLASSTDGSEKMGIQLAIELLDIDDPMALLSLRGVSFDGKFDTRGRSYPYWLGEWRAEARVVDAVTLDLRESRFHATGISMELTEQEVGDTLQVNCQIAFAGMEVNNDTLHGGRCEFEFRNINLQALEKLVTLSQELETTSLSFAENHVLLQRSAPIWIELLQASPQMELKHFGIDTNHGQIRASARVAFIGDGEFQMDALDQMLPRLRLDGEVVLPRTYVKSTMESYYSSMMMGCPKNRTPRAKQDQAKKMSEKMVDDMLQKVEKQGLLNKKGNTYSVSFRLDNGQFRLNGKGIEEFMKLAMS